MKKPTLEEVKEYFKNAETIESNGIKRLNHKDEYYEYKGSIFMGNGFKRCSLVWCKRFGYAKILTYKKPSFRPIAMRCTQEQFDSVGPKLEKSGLKIKVYEYFDFFCYLCSPKAPDFIVGNYKCIDIDREVHEIWNEKVFLEVCWIDTEEPKEEIFVITKEQIKEILNWSNSVDKERRLNQWFPKAFESEIIPTISLKEAEELLNCKIV